MSKRKGLLQLRGEKRKGKGKVVHDTCGVVEIRIQGALLTEVDF